jgi:hypothetical protein
LRVVLAMMSIALVMRPPICLKALLSDLSTGGGRPVRGSLPLALCQSPPPSVRDPYLRDLDRLAGGEGAPGRSRALPCFGQCAAAATNRVGVLNCGFLRADICFRYDRPLIVSANQGSFVAAARNASSFVG